VRIVFTITVAACFIAFIISYVRDSNENMVFFGFMTIVWVLILILDILEEILE